MEITLWECFKVSHEITIAFSMIALPLLALGVGKFRRRGTVISWKVFGGYLSLLLFAGGLLALFQPYLYPEDPFLSDLSLRLTLSLPMLIGGPIVYWALLRGRLTFFYHLPVEKFFPWIDELIQKHNVPLREYTEEYMEKSLEMKFARFDPKLGKIWRLEPNGPVLIAMFQAGPSGGTMMGSLGVKEKGDRKKLDPFLEKIKTEIEKIEVKPSPVAGLAFMVPAALIIYAIVYGIYVVCFTPPPL